MLLYCCCCCCCCRGCFCLSSIRSTFRSVALDVEQFAEAWTADDDKVFRRTSIITSSHKGYSKVIKDIGFQLIQERGNGWFCSLSILCRFLFINYFVKSPSLCMCYLCVCVCMCMCVHLHVFVYLKLGILPLYRYTERFHR